MKDFLDTAQALRTLAQRFGVETLVIIACLTLASIAAGLLGLIGPPEGWPSQWLKQGVQFAFLLLSAGGLFGAFFTLGYLAITRLWLKQNSIRVMAWEGYSEDVVLRTLPERRAVEVLEYVRGLGSISSLRLRGEPLDLLITDAEFLTHQHAGRWLVPFSSNRFDTLDPETYRKGKSPIWIDHTAFGVPIRWAPNDIMWNHDKAPGFEFLDYRDLEVSRLLDVQSDHKIGLWNWYLPTLQTLALAWYQTTKEKGNESTAIDWINFDWESAIGRYVLSDSIISVIKDNPARFRLIDSPHGIRDALDHAPLEEDSCWIVLGAGSWALGRTSPENVSIQHPSSGLSVWLECASLLATRRRTSRNAGTSGNHRSIVERTLDALTDRDTQVALARCQSYAAMPAAAAALRFVVQAEDTAFVKSASKLLNELNTALDSSKFFPRQLPEEHFRWEAAWTEVQYTLRRR